MARQSDRDFQRELDAMTAAAMVETGGRIILVDGFNVLHTVLLGRERAAGWWKRESRERLLRRIAGWTEGPDAFWVAFDGTRESWSTWAEPVADTMAAAAAGAHVHSVFVESADDWIVRRARRTPWPDRTVVVSADNKVAGRARSAGCEIWTPWGLIARCPAVVSSSAQREDAGETVAVAP
jgi:hypothetical protein